MQTKRENQIRGSWTPPPILLYREEDLAPLFPNDDQGLRTRCTVNLEDRYDIEEWRGDAKTLVLRLVGSKWHPFNGDYAHIYHLAAHGLYWRVKFVRQEGSAGVFEILGWTARRECLAAMDLAVRCQYFAPDGNGCKTPLSECPDVEGG